MAHVLVIDDEPQLREILTAFLESDGHTVAVAENGLAGLDQYRRRRADLVITDILMPAMDGIQLIHELRNEHPNVKVIAMSGGRRAISPQFNLESASLMGVRHVLAKPFSRRELSSAVKEALDEQCLSE